MTKARPFDILPAIDLRGGRVVRLEQGDFARETVYSDDPAAIADRFMRDGARWLHVVDLDAARTGTAGHEEAIATIIASARVRVRVEVAGGLRTEASVAEVLAAGAARAVIGTAALGDAEFAGRVVASHGVDRIAVAIDVRDGRAIGHGWATDGDGLAAADAIRRLADVGVETFEVTAIERDGLLHGPDLALYDRVVALERGSIIASAGIATIEHLEQVRQTGCMGAVIGRAFYDGSLSLVEALTTTEDVKG